MRRTKSGMLFVQKKQKGTLRLIIDCRKLDQRMRHPPRKALASSAALSEVQIPSGSGLAYASHDVADCFDQ